jgi:hypothetical protein
MAKPSRGFPFGTIAWIAAMIAIPAFIYDVFVGAASSLGSTNGSGHHDGPEPLSTAAVIAYVCGAAFAVSTVLAIGQSWRRRRRERQPALARARDRQ